MVPDELRTLYETHAPRIRALLYRFCGETELDDLVQDTFLKVWMNRESFRGEAAAGTWIYRIAINVAKDRLRARRRKWWLAFVAETPVERTPDLRNAERQVLAEDELRRALAALSPKLREVVVLFSFEELGIDQIAAILSLPAGTVKSRLHEARRRLWPLRPNGGSS